MAYPGVFQGNLHLYLWKPVPAAMGMDFYRYRLRFYKNPQVTLSVWYIITWMTTNVTLSPPSTMLTTTTSSSSTDDDDEHYHNTTTISTIFTTTNGTHHHHIGGSSGRGLREYFTLSHIWVQRQDTTWKRWIQIKTSAKEEVTCMQL